MNPVRVLIADDHPLVREGLKHILSMEEGFEIVGECGDGRQAVELCERLHPDIVLMDVHMPEEDGVSAASRLMERCPDVRVVMLSFNDGEEYGNRSVQVRRLRLFAERHGCGIPRARLAASGARASVRASAGDGHVA